MNLSANDWRAVCNELIANSGDFCVAGLCFELYESYLAFTLIKNALSQTAPLAREVLVAVPEVDAPFGYGQMRRLLDAAIVRAKVIPT